MSGSWKIKGNVRITSESLPGSIVWFSAVQGVTVDYCPNGCAGWIKKSRKTPKCRCGERMIREKR